MPDHFRAQYLAEGQLRKRVRGTAHEQQGTADRNVAYKIAEVDLFMAFKYFHKRKDQALENIRDEQFPPKPKELLRT